MECLYCGKYIGRGRQFCKGHNLAYRNRLVARYQAGDTTVATELARFGWLPADTEAPFSEISFRFRKFGVEIETSSSSRDFVDKAINFAKAANIRIEETGYNHRDVNYWKVLTDASLQGNYCREFVSPAFDTEAGYEEVKKMCDILSLLSVGTNNSCGLHVHLDVSDMTPRQLARAVRFYQEYEDEIDQLHQKSRRGQSVRYTAGLRHYRINPEQISSVNSLVNIIGTRYVKVNVEAYLRHGTLEFRQHGGTTNGMKIFYWIKFCTRILEYAKTENVIDRRRYSLFNALGLSEEEKTYWNIRKEQLRGVA